MHTANLKQKNRLLVFCSILVGIVCIAIFWYLSYFVRTRSTETINEVGNMYMNGLNERVTMHFRTSMDYRFNQLQEIIDELPPEDATSTTKLHAYLSDAAEKHDLKQLVLCGSDGWLDSLYGGQIKMYAQDLFVEALNDGDRWVATGFDENGETIQKFTNAIAKAQKWLAEAEPREIAETIAEFFPDTDLEVLEQVAARYQEIDAWMGDPFMTEDSFNRLQDVMEGAGELSSRAPYSELVNNSFAEKAMK